MTDMMTNTPGVTDTTPTLLARYANLRAPVRWMLLATLGVLLLSVVQTLGGDDTSVLTEPGTSEAMLRFAVPILLAGLGGLFSERAGVVNIGLEGMMVMGTWFGAWGTVNFGSPWAGLVCAAIGGALGGLLHAVATVSFGVDHIVSGVAINLLAPGLTRYLSDQVFSNWQGGSITQSPRAGGLQKITVPVLAGNDGLLGKIDDEDIFFVSDLAGVVEGFLTQVSLFTVLAYAMVPIAGWVLWKTRLGLRIRICGERPEAGESLGVNIYRYKYIGVIMSGALAGLAGGFIAMELSNVFREGQTQGRGFIGLAALIFGNWRPAGVMVGALLFGYPFVLAFRDGDNLGTHALMLVIAIALFAMMARSLRKGNRTDAIIAGVLAVATLLWWVATDAAPEWLPNTMPYAAVLLVLIFMSQRLRMPAADGEVYRKGGA